MFFQSEESFRENSLLGYDSKCVNERKKYSKKAFTQRTECCALADKVIKGKKPSLGKVCLAF